MTQQKKSGFVEFVKKYRKEILIGIIGVIALLFLIKNADEVTFDLVFFKTDMPLIFLLLLFAAIGAGIVALYWRMNHKDMKYKIKELQKELDDLKSNQKIEQ
jgi:uncharacterized integral membrane protein